MRHSEILRLYLAVLVALALVGAPAVYSRFGAEVDAVAGIASEAGGQLAAAVLSHSPKSIADIVSHYDNKSMTPQASPVKVRVLLVPGHEPDYGGAEYGDLKERNMTVELGQDLRGFLQNDGHYQVFMTRDASGWTPIFASYFASSMSAIAEWQKTYKQAMSNMISLGSTTRPVATIIHNRVPDGVAMRLYGMTKWANEHDIDITIHIHFNDDPTRPPDAPGKFSGLAVYVPVSQYDNSTTTHAIADAIFKRLNKYNPVSDMPKESAGIVDDPELIAVGANDTADSASMLIEYAYIYEPQFSDQTTRSLAIKDLAYQTYLGLEDFFNTTTVNAPGITYDTITLPYRWKDQISAPGAQGPDVFALQTALAVDGEYPPSDKTKNDCPRTGKLGPCTKEAIEDFQKKYGIAGEDGVVGAKTIQFLNQQYGFRVI